jgi:aminoglycoside phosphotransferase (APT) family kinase protein
MALDGTWDEVRKLRWSVVDHAGWEYLLPSGAGASWLCLDTAAGRTGALLAGLCGRLTIVPHDAARASEVAALLSGVGREARVAPWTGVAEGERFDGFLLHDLDGVLDREGVFAALAAARPHLAAGAFVYLGLRNRFGYGRLQRGRAALSGASRYFRAADFRQAGLGASAVVHPLISDARGRVLDVIMPTGYVSAQNPSRRGERLRRVLLGPRLAPVLAPAFACIASDTPRASILDGAVRGLEARRGAAPGTFSVRRYHCLRQGKVVISAGPAQGERFVLVFARDPVAIERRRREFALLGRLARLPESIARRIPRPFYEEEVAGAQLFVLEEFPGVTLEAAVAPLEAATREGAAFLARFHEATADRRVMTAGSVEALCGPWFETARQRYPVLEEALARSRSAICRGLAGVELPIVWLHGDFKVENLVVDPGTGALSGVIDWEISDPEGLPMLDLWYLLVYNRYIRERSRRFPALAGFARPEALPAHESAPCLEYARAMRVPDRALAPLVGAFIVHHCARRIFYRNDDRDTMERIRQELGACERAIESGRAQHA